MQTTYSKSFVSALLLIVFLTVLSCKTENKALTAYKAYSFDTAVIGKLPLYDSLALAISAKMPLIHKHIHADDSYHAFRYKPNAKDAEVFSTLPPELGKDIDRYFTTLGADFIYAFDVFKDSTIKLYIRSHSLESKVDMQENLSYFPAGKTIRHREYPEKDSLLNTNWQYWVRFDNPGLF